MPAPGRVKQRCDRWGLGGTRTYRRRTGGGPCRTEDAIDGGFVARLRTADVPAAGHGIQSVHFMEAKQLGVTAHDPADSSRVLPKRITSCS